MTNTPLSDDELYALWENAVAYKPIYYPEKAAPTPLLERTMRFIEDHPERHDQTIWMEALDFQDRTDDGTASADVPICGTTACFAGWGIALNDPKDGQRIITSRGTVVLADGETWTRIEPYAASLFGITAEQADFLFSSARDAKELRRAVDAIIKTPAITEDELFRVVFTDD